MTELYKQCIKLWGEDSQMQIAIEECAELVKAICKFQRYKSDISASQIAEEIADVEIMIEQLKIIFNCPNEVNIYKGAKLVRLGETVKKHLQAPSTGG